MVLKVPRIERYMGVVSDGKAMSVRDPETNEVVGVREIPDQAWDVVEVPAMAIVDRALWLRVQSRLGATPVLKVPNQAAPWRLLSNLVRCGACGTRTAYKGAGNRFQCRETECRGFGDAPIGVVEAAAVRAVAQILTATPAHRSAPLRPTEHPLAHFETQLEAVEARLAGAFACSVRGDADGQIGPDERRRLEARAAALRGACSRTVPPNRGR